MLLLPHNCRAPWRKAHDCALGSRDGYIYIHVYIYVCHASAHALRMRRIIIIIIIIITCTCNGTPWFSWYTAKVWHAAA